MYKMSTEEAQAWLRENNPRLSIRGLPAPRHIVLDDSAGPIDLRAKGMSGSSRYPTLARARNSAFARRYKSRIKAFLVVPPECGDWPIVDNFGESK